MLDLTTTTGAALPVRDPATGETFAHVPDDGPAEASAAVGAAGDEIGRAHV